MADNPFLMEMYGYKFIESWLMTEPGKPYDVPRTWKERWFTRPWRPWKRTKTITPQVPMRRFFIDSIRRTITGHPETIRAVKTELKGGE
jgi:hypothetical protein